MNPIAIFTITTLLAFAVWVESYRLRLALRIYTDQIYSTWGRSSWVYSNQRTEQYWMEKNLKQ